MRRWSQAKNLNNVKTHSFIRSFIRPQSSSNCWESLSLSLSICLFLCYVLLFLRDKTKVSDTFYFLIESHHFICSFCWLGGDNKTHERRKNGIAFRGKILCGFADSSANCIVDTNVCKHRRLLSEIEVSEPGRNEAKLKAQTVQWV